MSDREDKPRTWPAHVVKQGHIEAAIWERRNPETGEIRHSVALSRSYKTQEGQWIQTSNFDRKELGVILRCAEKAQSWIFSREQELARERARSQEPVEVRKTPHTEEVRRQIKELISTLTRPKGQDVQKILDSKKRLEVDFATKPEDGQPTGHEERQSTPDGQGRKRPIENDP
jgi:hypothetical protein